MSYSWNWSKQYKGSWKFSVGIGLPKPVDFIGITFNFKVSYLIDLSLKVTTSKGINPYQVRVGAVVLTKLDTDAKAAVKVIAIQGGVFIKGTLVKVATDPTFTLAYYFPAKQIKVYARWYFWLYAFQYKWGFFYKYWTFWKGWSKEKIIKQWTIKHVFKKYTITNKNWIIKL